MGRAGGVPRGGAMPDLVMLLVVVLFFALSLGFVSLCDRLR